MKKLTAGIFASLLAVVATGAAHAEIASKGYVDDINTALTSAIGNKADTTTVTALDGRVEAAEGEIDTIQGTMKTYGDVVTHNASEFATAAQGTKADSAVQPAAISDMQVKANLTTTAKWETDKASDDKYPSNAAVDAAISKATEGIASDTQVSQLGNRVEALETASKTHATKTELTSGLELKANTADLGDLATLDAVGSAQITDGAVSTADIANKAVTEAKLSDTVNASLDLADSALQQADLAAYQTKTAADAAYAVKSTEQTASTASTNAQSALTNIGTLTNLTTEAKTNTVAAINEVASEAAAAASAASAADTKADQAQTAADTAQGDVDALEGVVNNAETGLAAAHTAIDALESGKLDKTGTAARATADASGNVITTTYATKAEIADLATDENLAKKQDKTDNTLATTNKTVVGAINEVKTTADGASTAAGAAQDAADAAQADATQALEDAATAQTAAEAAQTAADSKLPTTTYNNQVGTVSATNMGTTASTVVTAIKEVAGEASTAQQTATEAQQTANAAIPAPTAACADSANKCVLVSSGAGNYSWEVIARGGAE